MEFIYFKSVIGITLFIVLVISFINLISIENTSMILNNKIDNTTVR